MQLHIPLVRFSDHQSDLTHCSERNVLGLVNNWNRISSVGRKSHGLSSLDVGGGVPGRRSQSRSPSSLVWLSANSSEGFSSQSKIRLRLIDSVRFYSLRANHRHLKTLSMFEKSSVHRCLPSAINGYAIEVFASAPLSLSLRVITTHAEGSFPFTGSAVLSSR